MTNQQLNERVMEPLIRSISASYKCPNCDSPSIQLRLQFRTDTTDGFVRDAAEYTLLNKADRVREECLECGYVSQRKGV